MKKNLLFAVIALLVISGCDLVKQDVLPNNNESLAVIDDDVSVIPEPEQEDLKLSFQIKNIEQSNENYLAKASYPEYALAGNEAINNLNAGIKTKVDVLMNNFLDLADEEPIIETPDLGSQIDIAYEVYTENEQVISLAFTYYSYMSGAAHGFNGYDSYSYDLVNNIEIGLIDLFVPDSNYLEALSYMATEYFDNKFEEGTWFAEGVEPEIENFSTFVLTEDAIIFLFENYAVVPYVLGPQEWEVKYSDVSALLDQTGPIKYFN